ncbi:hypothetical protein HDU97_001260 [Phlyctochytrium planicorne]|nr:hypothetical protein HDU97_001260 [Phlyctochytrium planicorne]
MSDHADQGSAEPRTAHFSFAASIHAPSPSGSTLTQRKTQQQTSSPSADVKHEPSKCKAPTCREEALKADKAFMDKTVTIQEMPSWYHDSSYIVSGYRKIQFTYRGCIRSLFYLHNESGNVYTHLIGALLFVALIPLTFFYPSFWLPMMDTTTHYDIVTMTVFMTSAIICMGLSTTFHLCCCHSQEYSKAWNKADYLGIVILQCGSFVPAVYYGFYCEPSLQFGYLSTIFLLGGITSAVTMTKKFSTPKYRYLRTGLFISLGMAGVVPLTHSVLVYGFEFSENSISLHYLVWMGVQYVIGAFIYASRVPERWYPGKFDIFFHSHQIFHVLVVTAAITHYFGMTKAYTFWHEHNHACDRDVYGLSKALTLGGLAEMRLFQ